MADGGGVGECVREAVDGGVFAGVVPLQTQTAHHIQGRIGWGGVLVGVFLGRFSIGGF